MATKQGAVFTFTGNCYFQDRPSALKHERFLKLVDVLRQSDASFTNLELVIQDGEDWPAHVAGNGRAASYLGAPPLVVEELKWMGIRMVYAANNHSSNFGEGGVLTTVKYLEAGGLPYAGIGPSLSRATAPGFLETASGRVALVSAADWGPRGRSDLPYQMPVGVIAGDGDGFFKSRPGVNLVRYDAVNTVDRAALDALRRISRELGWEEAKATRRAGGARAEPFLSPKVMGCEQDTDKEFHFMGRKFVEGDRFDFRTEPFQEDLERNERWIRTARRQADWVVVAYHDQGARRAFDEEHTRVFARRSIDAGADIFVNHGARHGGVEFYKGKVILYGQPPFYFQNESVRHAPPELLSRWGLGPQQTIIDFLEQRAVAEGRVGAVVGQRRADWRGSCAHQVVYGPDRQVKEVRVLPLDIPNAGPIAERGATFLAEPGSETAMNVLQRAAERCKDYGTRVEVRDGVGYVRPK